MAEDKKEAEAKEGEVAPPKKSKKLVLIVVGGLVLLLVGVGGFFALGSKEEVVEEEEPKEEVKTYETIEFDPFIVNLSENASFLKVKLLVEYDPSIFAKYEAEGAHGSGGGEAKGPVMPGKMVARYPIIRDAVIRILSSKTATELLTLDGKDTLKEELVEAINTAIGLDEGPVVGVYYVEFMIQ